VVWGGGGGGGGGGGEDGNQVCIIRLWKQLHQVCLKSKD
jgi:hypothetical protein